MTRFNKWLIGGAAALVAALALAQTATRFAAIRVDNLTNNRVIIGGGTSQLTPLPAGTTTTVLHGDASGTPAYAAVSLTTDVSGTLGAGNGGLGITTTTDDTTIVANGSGWVASAIPTCSGGSSALTYNVTTNAFGCNTISSGGTITSGTFTVTYPNCCTTTPTQNWAFTKFTDGVTASCTVYPTDIASGTGDAVTFNNSGGTQLAAAERPVQQQVFWAGGATNNGASVAATLTITTTGGVFLGNSTFDFNGAWTNSGAREWPATNLSFPSFTYRCTP